MAKWAKLIRRILEGRSDASISFSELRNLLLHLGFAERTKGSHHIFHQDGIDEMINPHKDGGQANSYQVKQVRELILRHNLGELDDA